MRKPTKCLEVSGCPEPPAFLISSHRLDNKPVCLEHGRGYMLSTFYTIVSLWDEAPRIAKRAAKKAEPKRARNGETDPHW